MYIKCAKRSKGGRTYVYHQLVQAVRTPQGPRQKIWLNLGKLPLRTPEERKALACRIEELASGQEGFPHPDERIEALARHFAPLLVHRMLVEEGEEVGSAEPLTRSPLQDFRNGPARSIGREAVAHWAWKRLGLDRLLGEVGLTERERQVAALLVIGRTVKPGSERSLFRWAQEESAIEELLGTDFQQLSPNTLYQVLDRLVERKEAIEEKLYRREQDLFRLPDTLVLYDLTNTFLEGTGKRNPKARHGHSKDGRHDCPLLTLGLALDGEGFVRRSQLFSGNTAEVTTLLEMVEALRSRDGERPAHEVTVVVDRGLVSEENLKALRRRGYHYVVMAHRRLPLPEDAEPGEPVKVVERAGERVEVRSVRRADEVVLVCQSERRRAKEQAMRQRWESRYEAELERIAQGLKRPKGVKRYEKVLKRLGRLQALYPSIATYYEVEVREENGVVRSLRWHKVHEAEEEARFSGQYFLRTSHQDWSEEQIWKTYVLLTEVEETFRVLKEELVLRPIFHQKEDRAEAHLFVSVLAYHLVHAIRTQLRSRGIAHKWKTLREILEMHARLTTQLREVDGKTTYVRNTTEPTFRQRAILDALGIPPQVLPRRRLTMSKA